MPGPPILSNEAIETALSRLDGWRVVDDALHREFAFVDFVAAFGFMTRVAMLAERANHHPEWSNVYKRVTIRLRTHESDGITERDTALAAEIDALLG